MCAYPMLRLLLLCQFVKPFKDCLISRFLRSQKYGNVQKGVGDMMRGALIETEEARTILNQGRNEMKKKVSIKMLNMGKLTIEEIAECSELSVAEVEQLAEL